MKDLRHASLGIAVLGLAAACRAAAPSAAEAPQWIRGDDSLRAELRLPSGRAITFVDDTTEGDRYLRHSYTGGVEGTDFVAVEETYYESWRFRLVHAETGRQTALPQLPVVSPDRQRLLVASGDLEAGYVPNVVQVWRIVGDTLELEWELETADYAAGTGWAASSPRWMGDTVAVVTQQWLRGGVPAPDTGLVRIVRRDGSWTVETRAPDA